MNVHTYSHLRQHLKKVMDEVCESREPAVITRRNGDAVVVISLEEMNAIEETLHLMRSPANAERLLRSVADAEAGKAEPRDLDEG